ncbi:hypothetical protein AVEN_45666-1 [Araneus ventricosus]|uniref:Uncharacterized protein n=1 Tax=Araneus ventricosus TaxID=182803 RepID=A0A4Y2SSK1_ARAVE|nr:hypothetical protein AVEN_45666-1 [Araneus ventricosus]
MQGRCCHFETFIPASYNSLGEPRAPNTSPYTHVATPARVDLWLSSPSGAVDIRTDGCHILVVRSRLRGQRVPGSIESPLCMWASCVPNHK